MLNITIQQNNSLSDTIEKNQMQFNPLLERLIDHGDPMVVLVKNSLKVTEIEEQNDVHHIAHATFQSKSIASCHGEDYFDTHKIKLPFKVASANLVFNLTLPPAWTFDY